MAAHLAALRKPSSEPILRSIRRAALDMFPSLPDPGIKDVAPVRQYHVRARARARGSASGSVGGIEAQESDTVVDLELEDGTIVRDVDYVLLGTGYGFSLPWISLLRRAPPSSQPPTSDTPGLHNASGSYTPLTPPIPVPRIPNLYRHTLHAHNPSLGFVGLAVSSSPFITSDLCSRWIRNVWNGGIAIPNSSEERAEDEKSRLELLERRAKESKVQAQPHKNGAPADGSTKSPAGASAFHILGTDEPSFAQLLRVEIVDAEPHLEDVLERWDEAQEEERLGMYKRKLRSLYEARERAERADRGEGKEITWNQNKSAGQSAHL